jgi:hypothetical protein
MTDAATAMAEFVKERGVDPAPPPSVQILGTQPLPMIKVTIITSLCSLAGWVTGAVFTAVLCSRKARENRGIKL